MKICKNIFLFYEFKEIIDILYYAVVSRSGFNFLLQKKDIKTDPLATQI